jgi:cell division transport system permease protein
MGQFMRFINSFIAFSIPMIAMLMTFSMYLIVNKLSDDYSNKISKDYSIVIVSSLPISKAELPSVGGIGVKSINQIQKEAMIKRVKKNLTSNAIKALRAKLPYVYQVYLQEFPTSLELTNIKEELDSIQEIKKVEIFSKNHNRVYILLLLINNIVQSLFIVILLFTLMVLATQVKIWFLEHGKRISIILLLGGSTIYAAKPIIQVAFIGSILSSIIAFFVMDNFTKNILIIFHPEVISLLKLDSDALSGLKEFAKILTLSFGVSFLGIAGVLVRKKS